MLRLQKYLLLILWLGTFYSHSLAKSVNNDTQIPIGQNNDFQSGKAHDIMRYAKAAEMRNFMKRSVNPCDDFYTYACGNWGRMNPAHLEEKTGVFSAINKAFNRKIARILRAPKRSSESDMDRKVKYFYESCLAKNVKSTYHANLLSVMEEFGGMPALKGEQWQADKFDWLEVLAKILRKYGKEIIIGVDISADLTNNEVNRLYIGQMDDLVASRAKDFYARLKLVRQMELQHLLDMDIELASETASDIVDFAYSLAEGVSDPHEGLGMEDKTRLRLLDEMSESYKPMLNFTRFVNLWLGYDYRLPVYEVVESYQRNLRNLIERTPKHVVANYIMWELLQDFRLDFEDKQYLQQMKCVDVTKRFFLKNLDNMVYRQVLRHQAHMVADVHQMWKELKMVFEETLKSDAASWLTESTKDKALEKLSAMTFAINSYENEDFDKEFGDLVITNGNFFDNIINILELQGRNLRFKLQEQPKLDEADVLSFSAGYAPEFNRVLIPVAFLQPHFFWHNAYPAVLKYSTIGYIIAHEIGHGFDDTLRKYDAKGNLNNWWDRQSTEEYTVRKECLRQQFSEFIYGGQPLERSNAHGENIADNIGIRIAFDAYQKWLIEQTNSTMLQQESSLPHMDYTPRQLFFIGLAQVWCADVNRYLRRVITITDVHAPAEVRVMAMLSNFDEFALEFKCPLGSKLNPRRKCIFF